MADDVLRAERARLGLDQARWWQYVDWIWPAAGTWASRCGQAAGLPGDPDPVDAQRRADGAGDAPRRRGLDPARHARRAPAGDVGRLRAGACSRSGPVPAVLLVGVLIVLLLLRLFGWSPPLTFDVRFRQDPVANLSQLVWPALVVGFRSAALSARMMRSALLEVLGDDYIRTARSKGLSERAIVRRHAVRNALLPVITVVGLESAVILGGLVVTEQVFNLNGLGKLLLEAVSMTGLHVDPRLCHALGVGLRGDEPPGRPVLRVVGSPNPVPLASGRASSRARVWRLVRAYPLGALGAVVLGVMVVAAVFAPWLAPYDPLGTNYSMVVRPPSAAHPLGTDQLRRAEPHRLWRAHGPVRRPGGLLRQRHARRSRGGDDGLRGREGGPDRAARDRHPPVLSAGHPGHRRGSRPRRRHPPGHRGHHRAHASAGDARRARERAGDPADAVHRGRAQHGVGTLRVIGRHVLPNLPPRTW